MFEDRSAAGEQLADRLDELDITADLVVAIPRGGLPVARPIADRLSLPLDVVVARKIGAPGNPELAIGAVTSDGTVWLHESIIDGSSIDKAYIDEGIETEGAAASRKLERYRGSREPPTVKDRHVIIVDDGVATGATMFACVEELHQQGASRITVAVPVGSPTTIDRLRSVVDEIVCLEQPRHFGSVGRFYQSFSQVSDEEAVRYLEQDQSYR